MNKNIPLYYNEDKTKFGVLVSYGFGAGWSTWEKPELAYDRRVIEFWLAHKNDAQWKKDISTYSREMNPVLKEAYAFFKSIGYNDVYFGGFANCELEWVPVGARFRINEYDGAESLEIENEGSWW